MGAFTVRVQGADFDVASELARLHGPDVGALASFVGLVRGSEGGAPLAALELEHYPGMTERAIAAMLDAGRARFALTGAAVIHRVGRLPVGARIVLVATASSHRQAAFDACAFLMDYLKTQAPFWKRAHTANGAHWVAAKADDDAALARWGLASANAERRA